MCIVLLGCCLLSVSSLFLPKMLFFYKTKFKLESPHSCWDPRTLSVQDNTFLNNFFLFFSYHLLPLWWTWAQKQQNTAWSHISAAVAHAHAAHLGSRRGDWPASGSWMCDCFSSDHHWTTAHRSLQERHKKKEKKDLNCSLTKSQNWIIIIIATNKVRCRECKCKRQHNAVDLSD